MLLDLAYIHLLDYLQARYRSGRLAWLNCEIGNSVCIRPLDGLEGDLIVSPSGLTFAVSAIRGGSPWRAPMISTNACLQPIS